MSVKGRDEIAMTVPTEKLSGFLRVWREPQRTKKAKKSRSQLKTSFALKSISLLAGAIVRER
jgi:hypothetical protein